MSRFMNKILNPRSRTGRYVSASLITLPLAALFSTPLLYLSMPAYLSGGLVMWVFFLSGSLREMKKRTDSDDT